MNKKFLPSAVLFIIAFVLSNLALLKQVKAQNTFYGDGAGANTVGNADSAFGEQALYTNIIGAHNTATGNLALFLNTGDYDTANGSLALYSNTTGHDNTATGYLALAVNTTGNNNTASGSNALYRNTTGGNNAASGAYALQANTTGEYNTASGAQALYSNATGDDNTASGFQVLFNNNGSANTASGYHALYSNTTGNYNTASGAYGLRSNTTGNYNSVTGYQALYSNTIGGFNAADGAFALYSNTTGNFNSATGPGALFSNTTGSNNVAIGLTAGMALTTGSGNVCIGAGVNGVAGESNTTRIRNVYTTVANGRAVYVNADNKIGTLSSSRRFKEDIQPMDRSSDTIFALKPVTFCYKKDVDASQAFSFGLIAEDVAQVSPELITRDEEGKPQTVRYEAVNGMLLNEFQKEHKTVQQQGQTIARLEKQLEAVTATLQKVSAQLELSKPTPQTVLNDQLQGR